MGSFPTGSGIGLARSASAQVRPQTSALPRGVTTPTAPCRILTAPSHSGHTRPVPDAFGVSRGTALAVAVIVGGDVIPAAAAERGARPDGAAPGGAAAPAPADSATAAAADVPPAAPAAPFAPAPPAAPLAFIPAKAAHIFPQ